MVTCHSCPLVRSRTNQARRLAATVSRVTRRCALSDSAGWFQWCGNGHWILYLWNTPWATKNAGGRRKGLLIDAVADLLPEAVLKRKKTSFPVDPHPGCGRLLRTQLRDELADPGSRSAPLLDRTAMIDRRVNVWGPAPLPTPVVTGRTRFR